MNIDRKHVLELWQGATLINGTLAMAEAEHSANLVMTYKPNFYDPVEQKIGVPWYLVAALDMREESFNHRSYLGNGDPLWKVTSHVPRGRGPFKNWFDGAADALALDHVAELASGGHWDIVTVLIKCELFNGTGYEAHHVNSPYIWAGTNRQQMGKYTADGKYDPRAWDKQLGCAALFLALKNNHGIDLKEA